MYFTKEFLDIRHWSRNPKFCGKSWVLHCYQTFYWHFCGKHSQCCNLVRALKIQIYLKLVKAFRASSLLCLPYRDTDRCILPGEYPISILYILFKGSSIGQLISLFCWTLASIVSPSIRTEGMQCKWREKKDGLRWKQAQRTRASVIIY